MPTPIITSDLKFNEILSNLTIHTLPSVVDLKPFTDRYAVASLCTSQTAPDEISSSFTYWVAPRRLSQFRTQQEESTMLEKWEGYVCEILLDGFRAKFKRKDSDAHEIVAEFDFEELDDDDQKILAVGMPLIWSITRERRRGGIQRCSTLVLRRQLRDSASSGRILEQMNEWIQSTDSESTSAR